MADYDLPLKKPGLGLLLLNGSALTLLHSASETFEKSDGIWTRLAIVCFGVGAMAGVVALFAEAILPETVFLFRDFETPAARLHALRESHELKRMLARWQLGGGLLLAAGLLMVGVTAFSGMLWLRLIPFAMIGGGIFAISRVGVQLRRESEAREMRWLDLGRTPPAEATTYAFATRDLPLHQIILALALGAFALGIIAAVNQPFTHAATKVKCSAIENEENCPGDEPRRPPPSSPGGRQPPATPPHDQPGPPPAPPPTPPVRAVNVPFAFKSATLDLDARKVLPALAAWIRTTRTGGPVIITGHTDAVGTDAYNLRLSAARATAVAQWLATDGGLPLVPFTVRGRGAREPLAPDTFPDGRDNPAGRQANRRVTATVNP